jgi:two-component system sensor histidine kinase AlgZ
MRAFGPAGPPERDFAQRAGPTGFEPADSIDATPSASMHSPPVVPDFPDSASSRPLPLRASGFGTTIFDLPGAAPLLPVAAASLFDVCHVGVVLRALLFVHGVVAVGVLFGAGSPAAWLALLAAASGIALPAVLMWLLVACALKRVLGVLPTAAQWAAAIALGAASGALGAALGALSTGDMPAADTPLAAKVFAAAVAGAALAGALFLWLALRAQATLPADTTARLAELQSRIRPHFLFNTLNTALALVRHDPARAEGVLEDLAELFRVAISDSREAVTLAEEVELAQRYLAIEQIRFGSRLQVTWEIDPAAGAARVPPLLLQPLVENAVRHGVEPGDAGGTIRVRTQVKLGRAVISIANSVPGAPSRPGSGMALRNVRERLRLMHDVAAQFDTRLERGVFRVQIVVPL